MVISHTQLHPRGPSCTRSSLHIVLLSHFNFQTFWSLCPDASPVPKQVPVRQLLALSVITPLLLRYIESAKAFMRKCFASSTVKSHDFAWSSFAMRCVCTGTPLKHDSINTACAFICYCMDARHFKPHYICGLLSGIQFSIRCYDPSFPSLFSNPAIKLLLKGISKVSPSVSGRRLPIILSIL